MVHGGQQASSRQQLSGFIFIITDIPIKRTEKLRVSECLGFCPKEKHIIFSQGTSFASQPQQVMCTCK